MPVPFRDLRSDDQSVLAGYLRFVDEDEGRGVRGSLFIVNARAEPVDFTFSRVDVPASFLWRPGEARRQAIASLTVALLTACSQNPTIILTRHEEVPLHLFADDVLVHVPLCRVATGADLPYHADGTPEQLTDSTQIYWIGQSPPPDSAARNILEALSARGLMIEPFERAGRGIEEAFSSR